MALFSRIHVHAPFASLGRTLPLLGERGVSPEVYLSHGDVEPLLAGAGGEVAARIAAAGMATTVHAPFGDLDPGTVDEGRRRAVRDRMRRALEAAAVFSPGVVVFHPGSGPGESPARPLPRLRAAVRTWQELLPLPPAIASCAIAIENIYDEAPDGLAELLAELPSPPFGCCFDTGHFQMFAPRAPGELDRWVERLAPRIRITHLHDNAGRADEHLPPGQGRFDFPRWFALLASLPHPVVGTLEMHTPRHVEEGLAALGAYGVL